MLPLCSPRFISPAPTLLLQLCSPPLVYSFCAPSLFQRPSPSHVQHILQIVRQEILNRNNQLTFFSPFYLLLLLSFFFENNVSITIIIIIKSGAQAEQEHGGDDDAGHEAAVGAHAVDGGREGRPGVQGGAADRDERSAVGDPVRGGGVGTQHGDLADAPGAGG